VEAGSWWTLDVPFVIVTCMVVVHEDLHVGYITFHDWEVELVDSGVLCRQARGESWSNGWRLLGAVFLGWCRGVL
jgi:hypothetical protein